MNVFPRATNGSPDVTCLPSFRVVEWVHGSASSPPVMQGARAPGVGPLGPVLQFWCTSGFGFGQDFALRVQGCAKDRQDRGASLRPARCAAAVFRDPCSRVEAWPAAARQGGTRAASAAKCVRSGLGSPSERPVDAQLSSKSAALVAPAMLDAIRWFVGSAIASIVVGLRKVGLKGLRSPRNTAGAPSAAPPAPVSTALLMFQDPLAPIADKAPSPYKELKSQDSRHSIHLRFKNTLDEPIKIYWIGYDVRYAMMMAPRTAASRTPRFPNVSPPLTQHPLRLLLAGPRGSLQDD